MTRGVLLALPVAVDLDTANKALTIGRSTGYALAKRDEYPGHGPSAGRRVGPAARPCPECSHASLFAAGRASS